MGRNQGVGTSQGDWSCWSPTVVAPRGQTLHPRVYKIISHIHGEECKRGGWTFAVQPAGKSEKMKPKKPAKRLEVESIVRVFFGILRLAGIAVISNYG